MKTKDIVVIIAMLVGLGLIGTGVLLDPARLGALLKIRSLPSDEVHSLLREFRTFRGCAICLGTTFVRDVAIDAPREMRIDESATIRFSYSDRRTELPPSESTVSFSFDVTLSGANFDVKPTETQKVVSRTEGPGAANLAWTVKPKGTGKHIVILDFAGLVQNVSTRQVQLTTNVAGLKASAVSSDAIVEFPIAVLSEWNLPSWAVNIVKAAFGLTGFIFVTPGVWWLVRQLRSRLQRSRTSRPLRRSLRKRGSK
jgi:hypothetical protein